MQALLDNLTLKLGEKNPQIFRELKGRLTVKNTIVTMLISFGIQGFLLLNLLGELPQKPSNRNRLPNGELEPIRVFNRFCEHQVSVDPSSGGRELCKLDAAGNFIIKWPVWWESVWGAICFIIPTALILGCVYLLITDLAREEKRGTLNFIRLSPQSPWCIFTGKIIGVPVLPYLGIVGTLPLFFLAGIQSGVSIFTLLLWLVTMAGITWFFTSATILYALLGGVQAILTTFVASYLLSMPLIGINAIFSVWNQKGSWNIPPLYWYFLSLSSHLAATCAFGLLCCGLATYWIWRAIERRYLNPHSPVLSKISTYWISGSIQFILLGFGLPIILNFYNANPWNAESIKIGTLILSICLNWTWGLMLILITLPQRQLLIDWSRYRRERDRGNFLSRDLWKDFLTNDKSPAIVNVIANSLLIAAANLPLVFLVSLEKNYLYRWLIGGAISIALLTIYTTIFHLGIFIKWKRRNIVSTALVAGGVFIPVILFGVFGYGSSVRGIAGNFILFSPFLWLKISEASIVDLIGTLIMQILLAGILIAIFTRRLNRLGESMMRAAMQPSGT
jgi:hypothetical protein